MKKSICLVVALCCLATVALAVENMETQLVPSPSILSVPGTTSLVLDAGRWPKMTSSSDNPNCDNVILPQQISLKCKTGNCNDYTATDLKKNYSIPADYRKTSTLVVSWVLRVVGQSASCPNPWPRFCKPFHGRYNCSYPAGEVRSRLFINGNPVGQEAVMTVPGTDSKGGVNVSDPTNTGSAVIDASLFGGTFPETVNIEVRWRNDSAMKVSSAVKEHSMEIMFLPLIMGEKAD
ncbi:MAG: hypothetical protein JW788_00745 [Candidatus Omnitrophica bacterium]|nr:hypothetical protein [Candidatus Omnitrophota bacterium]